jgi:hypothetical protein
MAVACIFFLALFSHAAPAAANQVLDSSDLTTTNPIRKVVNMLQTLQKKVTTEGEKEQALYDKFKCYCSNAGGTLGKSISDAETKVPSIGSDIEAGEAKKKQDTEDLKKAKADRAEAKAAIAEATAIRDKEAGIFAADHAESTANLAALTGAITSIGKGVAGFLQTKTAQRLRKVVLDDKDVTDFDRDTVISFLSGKHTNGYVPQSGEIVGVLKDIKDNMDKSHADMESTESKAIASYEELMTAKTKQVKALAETIETKSVRVGSLSVEIMQMKADLSDTQAALQQDKQFLANMDHDCATKASEYDANTKLRSAELLAIADTIKMLSDDDALELFKRSLPSTSASFLQTQKGLATQRSHALLKIAGAQKKAPEANQGLDFIAMAIKGNKVSFAKVIKMIDGMTATLKREQADEDEKHKYCTKQFDSAEDKKKGLERMASDLDTSISKGQDAIAMLEDEIKAIEDGIKALDKEVAEATEQRKEENKDFTDLMASDAAAKQLLEMAKTRLKKFYSPSIKASQDQSSSLVEVNEHQHEAPPPPPDAGGYTKNKDDKDSVISMIDVLIKDLDKELIESQTTEKDAQADYERAMTNSAAKRALDSKTLTDKGAAKASIETDVQDSKVGRANTAQEIMTTDKFISALHGECDFLLQYFDVRREARDGEIESLKTAKSVLLGADFSLVQEGRRLRGGN